MSQADFSRAASADFLVDSDHLRTVHQAQGYPMQMMVAVFDFPDKAGSPPADHVPELDRIRGRP